MHQFPSPRVLTAAVALLGAALLADPATAQAGITGRVVDGQSGRGVVGARVEVAGHHRVAITDSTGHFTLSGVRPGEHPYVVGAVGYGDASSWVTVAEAEPTVLPPVRLTPNPVMLEAIRVTADRFEGRRRAVPYSSRVFGDAQLALSAAPSLMHYLRERGGLYPTTCRDGSSRACVVVRGQPVSSQVYVDEVPHSLDVLQMYPLHEVSRVEVYRSGVAVHVYTTAYMERAARGGLVPMPLGI